VGDMLAPYRAACELAVASYRTYSGKAAVIAVESSKQERDTRVGPYRLDSNGNLQPVEVLYTAGDRVLADRYPWLRPSREALESSACGVDSVRRERGLIQLRRSKAAHSKVE